MAAQGLTVAVTGPTGDLGIAVVDALERSRSVKRVIGMARGAFDPAELGWRKTEYHRGDITDRASVRDAVRGADVVVHLAFSLMGAGDQTHAINVGGSQNVFEEAVRCGAERICYASSVAAYGFADDQPTWLDEEHPARGSDEFFYSSNKAEVEHILERTLARKRRTHAWVYRPCVVAGPRAQNLLDEMPYVRLSSRLPDAVISMLRAMPVLAPVIPDPGIRMQLVHEDDVASAFAAGVLGRGEPGAYNLAASGTITMSDLADELGWYAVPMPELALDAAAEVVSRMPGLPDAAGWIHSMRREVLMKTDRARKLLRWRPKHSARATLKQLVASHRERDSLAMPAR